MATLETHHTASALLDALDWAVANGYTQEQIDAARPLLNAYRWKILEIMLTSAESGEGHRSRERAGIEKMIGDLDHDLGPDGSPT